MHMADYLKQLDNLLSSIGEQVLDDKGRVSHKQAMEKAEREYRIYQQIELTPVEQDYLASLSELQNTLLKGENHTEK